MDRSIAETSFPHHFYINAKISTPPREFSALKV
jgi:hypothetical protein